MSSLLNREAEIEEKQILAISAVAYSLLYVFTVAMIYLFWVAYDTNNFLQLEIYVFLYSAFLVGFFLVVRDIYSNYDYFVQEQDTAGIELIVQRHFLCADLLCPRCGGWYFGLGLSFTMVAIFWNSLKDFMVTHAYSPYYLIALGIVMFSLATPVHGSLNFLKGFDMRVLTNKKLKLFCGFISGISLFLIAVGILVIVS